MKALKLATICTFSLLTSYVYANQARYDPAELKQFEETNSCPKCNLANATIVGAHQYANLVEANISEANFFSGDYTRADFSNTNNVGTVFSGQCFSEANFSNAKLMGASFVGRNLTGADFTNADVHDAKFNVANLFGAKITAQQLAVAASVCDATLPDGSKGKCT